ncbi:cytochrome c oxidase assembly protein [Arthrobacter sp. H14]|uniref:cytochrome c oxidase assembly protein n=1 Tax=Arthrobacter sp. H14 TaxID=1312959 RepID=UPI00047BA791|nr:cytochrome c oxidase assembly protein [Arthrobacter sp. H14]
MPAASNQTSSSAGPGTTAAQPGVGIGSPWLLVGLGATVLGTVLALIFSGAAAARIAGDPGAIVRWGLPLADAIHNMALAAVIGSLLFAVVILPKRTGGIRRGRSPETEAEPEHPAFARVMLLASSASVVWTLSAIAVLVFTFSDAAGLPVSSGEQYTSQLIYFMSDLEVGRAWLAVTIIAAIVSTLTFGVRSLTGLGLTAVLATMALVPMALVGHSASAADHEGAVSSLGLHLIGVCLWVGGIIALAVVSKQLAGSRTTKDITAVVLGRFSTLAGFAFVLVAASGIVNAAVRLGDFAALTSEYGQLVLVKTFATVLLGAIGFMHRQWVLPQLTASSTGRAMSARRALWQLILGELSIMGATVGVAVALSRTATPVPEELAPDATPARILTGYALPPELTPIRWLTEWRIDWIWIALALTLGIGYLIGRHKVSRRGDSWSWLRTISWIIGLLALTYFTSGPPAVYGRVLFSAHMVDHMALTMIVPIFLVLGAPITLALKALRPRGDGTRGIREWILVIVHSKFSQLVTHPIFVAVNFAGSIILFYYSPLFGFALREHIGHELMNLHFVITGYLFVLSLIGIDPVPRRAAYPLRLLMLLATMAFHAFFGVAIMGSTSLIQASWFGNLGRPWGPSALEDQQLGGAIAWGIGEIPTVAVAIIVAMMWSRTDARETKRKDRAADRNNESELSAYNDMFATLAERDEKIDERRT